MIVDMPRELRDTHRMKAASLLAIINGHLTALAAYSLHGGILTADHICDLERIERDVQSILARERKA